jgi:hypothetical protein
MARATYVHGELRPYAARLFMPLFINYFLPIVNLIRFILSLFFVWSCCCTNSQAAIFYTQPPVQKKIKKRVRQQRRLYKKRWRFAIRLTRTARRSNKKMPAVSQDRISAIFTTLAVGLLYLAGLVACIIGLFYFNAIGLYVLFTICGIVNIIGFVVNITTYLHDAASSVTMALVWVMIQLIVAGLILGISGLWIAGLGVLVFGITFVINILEAKN